MQFSDVGGGISQKHMPRLFEYTFSTAPAIVGNDNDNSGTTVNLVPMVSGSGSNYASSEVRSLSQFQKDFLNATLILRTALRISMRSFSNDSDTSI